MRRWLLSTVLATACAHAPPSTVAPADEIDDPAARAEIASALDGYSAAFRLTWNGARVGEASERFTHDARAEGGYLFERSEHIAVRRGGTIAHARTLVRIETNARLLARRLIVERWSGSTKTSGEAVRLRDDGWRIRFGTGEIRIVDGAAVPSTLVPLLVRGTGAAPGRAFAAPVLIEGAGLATARLTLEVGPDRRHAFAELATAAGTLRAEATLDERGGVAAAGGPTGLASLRVAPDRLDDPFVPPEIVDSAAVPVAGRAGPLPLRLRLHEAPMPPMLPDVVTQRVVPGGDTWDVLLTSMPRLGDARLADLRARTHDVARTLTDDLGVPTLAASEALAAGRGDCSAHALVLGARLAERGYATRLVTGFVYDTGALRRHRWLLVRLGSDWIPVDPILDEVPASPAHLALAVHGASVDELAFVDDVAFAGWDHARAEVVPDGDEP